MLATAGALPTTGEGWAFEFKWDGIRAILAVDGGRVRATSRNGRDITGSYPELRALGEAVGADQLLLDSELVVVDDGGRPSFGRLQHRMQLQGPAVARAAAQDPVSIVLFDLLHQNGEPLFDLPYDDRRARLEGLGLAGPRWAVTPAFVDEEPKAGPCPRHRHRNGRRGGQAARQPLPAGDEEPRLDQGQGRAHPRGRHRWLDDRPGQPLGDLRRASPGSARPERRRPAPLRREGRHRFRLRGPGRPARRLEHARRDTSPFTERLPTGTGSVAGWAEPSLVGEVRYTEWTGDGRLRHPVWRGLRSDKTVEEVVREP